MASVQRELWLQPCRPVCLVASASQTLLLLGTWSYICSLVGLSDFSPQQKAATEHGGVGTHTATLTLQLAGSSASIYIFPAPVALGLCHICLCCWSSDHWNPWREGDLSAQLYKTLCCIRHPKIVPTCFLVTPGGMRHHQWGIVGLKMWTKSGAEEAEFPESKAATRKVSLL